nr:extensin-like [Penaeus vannamei]
MCSAAFARIDPPPSPAIAMTLSPHFRLCCDGHYRACGTLRGVTAGVCYYLPPNLYTSPHTTFGLLLSRAAACVRPFCCRVTPTLPTAYVAASSSPTTASYPTTPTPPPTHTHHLPNVRACPCCACLPHLIYRSTHAPPPARFPYASARLACALNLLCLLLAHPPTLACTAHHPSNPRHTPSPPPSHPPLSPNPWATQVHHPPTRVTNWHQPTLALSPTQPFRVLPSCLPSTRTAPLHLSSPSHPYRATSASATPPKEPPRPLQQRPPMQPPPIYHPSSHYPASLPLLSPRRPAPPSRPHHLTPTIPYPPASLARTARIHPSPRSHYTQPHTSSSTHSTPVPLPSPATSRGTAPPDTPRRQQHPPARTYHLSIP